MWMLSLSVSAASLPTVLTKAGAVERGDFVLKGLAADSQDSLLYWVSPIRALGEQGRITICSTEVGAR